MGYEYDSKLNRDLARTAMSIYTKAHNIKPEPINESKQNINEEALRENINSLILNYVSDVIVLAEQELGREMTDVEINEASMELLDRINSISDEEKSAFVTQLAEAAGPSMTGMRPANPTNTSAGDGREGKGRDRAVEMTPSRPDNAIGSGGSGNYGIMPGEEGFAEQFSSVADYLANAFDLPGMGGSGLSYVLSHFGSGNPSMGQG